MKAATSHRISGFTLIEIMISIALGLLLTAGLVSMFIAGKRSYTENERAARLQENGRIALYFLANDLRHANFWGTVLESESIIPPSSSAVTGTCGSWGATLTNRFIGSATPATNSTLSCIGTSNIKSVTSAVAIKRVNSGPVNNFNTDLSANDVFLRGNSMSARMLQKGVGDGASPPDADETDWKYQPRIYFIRPYSTPGDGIPTLCVIQGNPALSSECLVEGIEDLHIVYGVDTDNDHAPDDFNPSPTADQMTTVVSIKIYVLVRDLDNDPFYGHNKSYNLGDPAEGGKTTAVLTDNFHRAVLSTTVIPYNQRNLPVYE